MAKGEILLKRAESELRKTQPDFEVALDLLQKSMELGNPKATYALGTWYFHGHNFKRNVSKGIKLIKLAASHNIPDAIFDMAVSYERGVGVNKNLKKAFQFYQKAALQGDKQAYYSVGRCYYHGIGTQMNRALAWVWIDKAKELGIDSEDASNNYQEQIL